MLRVRCISLLGVLAIGVLVGFSLVSGEEKVADAGFIDTIITCETYSVRDLFAQGKLTLETFPAMCQELGIKGMALNDMFFKSWDKEYLDKIKAAAKSHNRIIAAVIMGANLAIANEQARKNQIETLKERMRAAKYLGAWVVCIDVGSTGNADQDDTVGVERVSAAFNELLPLAKELGIKMTIENHGGVSRKADNILKVSKNTDPNWVGACLDFGNWPAKIRYEECKKLTPYTYHVHAKSYDFNERGEETRIDYRRILAMLKRAGYRGALSIEFEGGGDQVAGVKKTRDLILRHWQALTKEEEQRFTTLFNGKDLSGWTVMGDESWEVKDGLLVCRGEGGGWLRSDKEYQDFVLRLEYKVSKDGNSGVFIRSTKEGNPAFTGMEVQILDDYGQEPSLHTAGAIYDAVTPIQNMSKPAGEWNQYEITCKGRRVIIIMNGVKIVDVNLDENPKLKDRVPKGFVGVQNHGSYIEFRNIRIKVLGTELYN